MLGCIEDATRMAGLLQRLKVPECNITRLLVDEKLTVPEGAIAPSYVNIVRRSSPCFLFRQAARW